MITKSLITISAIFLSLSLYSQNRWTIQPDNSIAWTVTKGEAHKDNIEMSGRFISLITTYGVDEKGKLITAKQLVFPMLRTIPNDTHASLIYTFGPESEPIIKINNRPVNEQINRFSNRGILTIESSVNANIEIKREIFPSVDKPVAVERFTIENRSERPPSVNGPLPGVRALPIFFAPTSLPSQ